MTQVVLPRYFVASASSPAASRPSPVGLRASTGSRVSSAPPPAETRIEHCIDALLWHLPSSRRSEELVVGVDQAGVLQCALRSRAVLSPNAQRELHAHELLSANASRATARMVQADRLFLFDMELVEQAGSGGELNQPLFVYGTLLGPLASEGAVTRSKGQLALTRADLLEGLLLGQDWPFRYAEEPGRERKHHHAFLPGGRVEEIAAGCDLVIGYPRAPLDLSADDPENAAVVQLLIGELVAALRSDVERGERTQGTLSRWFGRQRSVELAAPEGHDIDAWLRLAANALQCLPEWPSPTAEALRKATCAASVRGRAITPEQPGIAAPTVSQPVAVAVAASSIPARPNLLRRESDSPPAWSSDFLPEQHRAEKDSTYLTWKAPAPAASTPSAEGEAEPANGRARENWMQDFTAEGPITPPDTTRPSPEWLKDFDDENE